VRGRLQARQLEGLPLVGRDQVQAGEGEFALGLGSSAMKHPASRASATMRSTVASVSRPLA